MISRMIPRAIESIIASQLGQGSKIVLMLGARQVGKKTLAQRVLSQAPFVAQKVLRITGDDLRPSEALSSRDLRQLEGLVSGYDILFIDEAQRIPEIGINLKLLVDHFPRLKILVTGSSALDLASKTREPLTGRAWVHTLFPIALVELATQNNPFELDRQLEERLIYGSYPQVLEIANVRERRDYLQTLVDAYLYKDVLDIATIKYSSKVRDLLQLLAYQVGQQVSVAKLATQLGIGRDAVDSYIDLLEQSFVLFRLRGYSRDLRKEVSEQSKIFFWGNGVRNALIDNLNPLSRRTDQGALWENYVIAERRKLLNYAKLPASVYFWRTHTGAELDWVEHREGKLFGYEFKWGSGKARPPETFLTTYAGSSFEVVQRENYQAFLTEFKDEIAAA